MPPADIAILRAALLAWYDAHARTLPWRAPPGGTERTAPYRVWLSEVMLQQTTVPHATPYFLSFTRRWPTVSNLAAEADGEVMAAWAGLGYYARARNLLACARAVAADHGGGGDDVVFLVVVDGGGIAGWRHAARGERRLDAEAGGAVGLGLELGRVRRAEELNSPGAGILREWGMTDAWAEHAIQAPDARTLVVTFDQA
eukprot:gene11078-biopygen9271